MPRNKGMQFGLQLTFICLQLTFAVPMSMAYFPQIATIKVEDMEPEFQGLKSQIHGNHINEFKFNKGL